MSTRPRPVFVNEPATGDVLELSLARQDLKARAGALARHVRPYAFGGGTAQASRNIIAARPLE